MLGSSFTNASLAEMFGKVRIFFVSSCACDDTFYSSVRWSSTFLMHQSTTYLIAFA